MPTREGSLSTRAGRTAWRVLARRTQACGPWGSRMVPPRPREEATVPGWDPLGGQRWTHVLGYTTSPAAHPGPGPSLAGAAAAWHRCQGSLRLQPPVPAPPCAPAPRLYPPAASEGTSDPGAGENNTPKPNPILQ